MVKLLLALLLFAIPAQAMTDAQARTEARRVWGDSGMVRATSTETSSWLRLASGRMNVLGSAVGSYEKAFDAVKAPKSVIELTDTIRIGRITIALDMAGREAERQLLTDAGMPPLNVMLQLAGWHRTETEERLSRIIEDLLSLAGGAPEIRNQYRFRVEK